MKPNYMQNLAFNTLLKSRWCALFAVVFVVTACEDVFEKDLSASAITLLAPGDSIRTGTSLVEFKWAALDNANYYRLQVAKPSFSQPERYVLDTLLSTTSFTFTMGVGTYQWQVRGENQNSETPYTRRTLFLDSITDLTKQVQVLKNPVDNDAFTVGSILFKWYKISIADSYTIEVHQNTMEGELVADASGVTQDTVRFTLPEGKYAWAVKAQGSTGSTSFSSARSLFVDFTAPSVSTPDRPVSGFKITDFPYSFEWTRPADVGSPLSDSLIILKANGTNALGFPKLVTATTFSVDTLPVGGYKWKLKTLDKAGNQSAYSTEIEFTVE